MLKEQTKAPTFTLPDQDGKDRSLTDFAGKWVLLYFYPKDDTPGCTKEACTIAEVYDEFSKKGVVVLGVSKDTVASHKKFVEKYHLPFILLSDEDQTAIKQYEAFGEKTMFGKKIMGTKRVSYLIDPHGTVVKAYPKVDPASHALEILQDVDRFVNAS